MGSRGSRRITELIEVALDDLVTKSHSEVLDLLERKSSHEGLTSIGYRAVEITDGGHVLIIEITALVAEDGSEQ